MGRDNLLTKLLDLEILLFKRKKRNEICVFSLTDLQIEESKDNERMRGS